MRQTNNINDERHSCLLGFSIIITFVGLFLMVYFALKNNGFNFGGTIDHEIADHYGSFISGIVGSIFSLVGILFLFITLKEQRRNNYIQQFEARLFELIRYHRENVNAMLLTTPYIEKETQRSGVGVFVVMTTQFVDIYNEIKTNFKETLTSELEDKQYIKISYIILFFGVSQKAKKETIYYLTNHCELPKDWAEMLVEYFHVKKAKYNEKIVFYGGHQSRLAQYFRQIYRTIKYIDNSDLTPIQKGEYAKLYRSQLSNYEQALLFINSLSVFGQSWNSEITDYELIRNIPKEFLEGIDPQIYYPKINFESGYDI